MADELGEGIERYQSPSGTIHTYVQKCGRYVEHGLWPMIRRQKFDSHSMAVSGACDMDAWSKVPVGPDRVIIGNEEVQRVIVAKAGTNRYACPACGTWICDKCGHKRLYANRRYSGVMSCAKKTCWSKKGKWRVGYHTLSRWWDHNDADIIVTGNSGIRRGGVVNE